MSNSLAGHNEWVNHHEEGRRGSGDGMLAVCAEETSGRHTSAGTSRMPRHRVVETSGRASHMNQREPW